MNREYSVLSAILFTVFSAISLSVGVWDSRAQAQMGGGSAVVQREELQSSVSVSFKNNRSSEVIRSLTSRPYSLPDGLGMEAFRGLILGSPLNLTAIVSRPNAGNLFVACSEADHEKLTRFLNVLTGKEKDLPTPERNRQDQILQQPIGDMADIVLLPLKEAFGKLAKLKGLQFEWDDEAVVERAEMNWSDLLIRACPKNVSVRSAINIMLKTLDTKDYRLIALYDRDGILITTAEAAEEKRYLRSYNVPTGIDSDALCNALLELDSGGSWRSNGGDGEAMVIGDQLLVLQTESNQENVQRLLDNFNGIKRDDSENDRVRAALKTVVSMDLPKTKLQDLPAVLQKKVDVNILLDNRALLEAGFFENDTAVFQNRLETQLDAAGGFKPELVASAEGLHAPLENVLNYLFRQIELDGESRLAVSVENGCLFITTKDEAQFCQTLRCYDLVPDCEPQFLIDWITQNVESPTWRNNGGEGSLCVLGEQLLVFQTPQGQLEVEAFLNLLKGQPIPQTDLERTLENALSMVFPWTLKSGSLRDLAQSIQKSCEIPVIIDKYRIREDEIDVDACTFDGICRDLTLEQFLDTILIPKKLNWYVSEQGLVISSDSDVWFNSRSVYPVLYSCEGLISDRSESTSEEQIQWLIDTINSVLFLDANGESREISLSYWQEKNCMIASLPRGGHKKLKAFLDSLAKLNKSTAVGPNDLIVRNYALPFDYLSADRFIDAVNTIVFPIKSNGTGRTSVVKTAENSPFNEEGLLQARSVVSAGCMLRVTRTAAEHRKLETFLSTLYDNDLREVKRAAICYRLAQPISGVKADEALKATVERLCAAAEVPLDWDAASIERSGIQLEALTTGALLRPGLPLRSALLLILEQNGLKCAWQGARLIVGCPQTSERTEVTLCVNLPAPILEALRQEQTNPFWGASAPKIWLFPPTSQTAFVKKVIEKQEADAQEARVQEADNPISDKPDSETKPIIDDSVTVLCQASPWIIDWLEGIQTNTSRSIIYPLYYGFACDNKSSGDGLQFRLQICRLAALRKTMDPSLIDKLEGKTITEAVAALSDAFAVQILADKRLDANVRQTPLKRLPIGSTLESALNRWSNELALQIGEKDDAIVLTDFAHADWLLVNRSYADPGLARNPPWYEDRNQDFSVILATARLIEQCAPSALWTPTTKENLQSAAIFPNRAQIRYWASKQNEQERSEFQILQTSFVHRRIAKQFQSLEESLRNLTDCDILNQPNYLKSWFFQGSPVKDGMF